MVLYYIDTYIAIYRICGLYQRYWDLLSMKQALSYTYGLYGLLDALAESSIHSCVFELLGWRKRLAAQKIYSILNILNILNIFLKCYIQCPTLNIYHTWGSPKKDVSNNYSLAICYIAIGNGHRHVVSVPTKWIFP